MYRKKLAMYAAVAALALTPFVSSADSLDLGLKSDVGISGNGLVHVVGASVTSVSGSVINAATNLGTAVLNWTVTTNASSTFAGKGHVGSAADISVGDKLDFTGMLTSIGAAFNVTAKSIHDMSHNASSSASSTSSKDSEHGPKWGWMRFFFHFGNRR